MFLKRSPWLAALLSYIFPGLGHLYCGAPQRGFIFIILFIILVISLLLFGLFTTLIGIITYATGSIILKLVLVIDSFLIARKKENYQLKTYNRLLYYIPYSFFITILFIGLFSFVRSEAIEPFKIPSGNMIPTLLIGDHLLVDKSFYQETEISRGDIVVFKFPEGSETGPTPGIHYVKRIIGVPGDEIDLVDRQLFINGKAVQQEYIGTYVLNDTEIPIINDLYWEFLSDRHHKVVYRQGVTATTEGNMNFPIRIEEGYYFAMGDNRDNSWDSRFWGFIPEDYIVGKAFMIHWSWDFDSEKIFHIVRWDRIGHKIP